MRRGALRPHNGLWHEDGLTHGRCMLWMMPPKIRICNTGEDSSCEQDPHDMRRGKNYFWGSNVDLVPQGTRRHFHRAR